MRYIALYLPVSIFVPLKSAQKIEALAHDQGTQSPPAIIEFAWDLHGVVLKKLKWAMTGHLIRNLPLFFKICTRKKYKKLRKALKQLRKAQATGEEYKELFLQYRQWRAAECIEKCALEQGIRQEVAHLIFELNHLGYRQRICSNIGSTFLSKIATKHPQLFNCFTQGTCSEYMNKKEPIKKPDLRFYQKHNQSYNPDGKKIIILIDDKPENITAARQSGWIAIKYNNIRQLRRDLRCHGILV